MLVNLTNGSYRMANSLDSITYREFCNEHTTLLTIKGQPTHPATPPRNSNCGAVAVATKEVAVEPKAPKKSRKRPTTTTTTVPKEKEEETVEPEAKKALFVEP